MLFGKSLVYESQMKFISLAIKPAFAIAIMEPEKRYIS